MSRRREALRHNENGGADVPVVQELLGHASVTTTQIYPLVTVHARREMWAGCAPNGALAELSRPQKTMSGRYMSIQTDKSRTLSICALCCG
jgi:hypothetical protein